LFLMCCSPKKLLPFLSVLVSQQKMPNLVLVDGNRCPNQL
jgi:hypothetical protein